MIAAVAEQMDIWALMRQAELNTAALLRFCVELDPRIEQEFGGDVQSFISSNPRLSANQVEAIAKLIRSDATQIDSYLRGQISLEKLTENAQKYNPERIQEIWNFVNQIDKKINLGEFSGKLTQKQLNIISKFLKVSDVQIFDFVKEQIDFQELLKPYRENQIKSQKSAELFNALVRVFGGGGNRGDYGSGKTKLARELARVRGRDPLNEFDHSAIVRYCNGSVIPSEKTLKQVAEGILKVEPQMVFDYLDIDNKVTLRELLKNLTESEETGVNLAIKNLGQAIHDNELVLVQNIPATVKALKELQSESEKLLSILIASSMRESEKSDTKAIEESEEVDQFSRQDILRVHHLIKKSVKRDHGDLDIEEFLESKGLSALERSSFVRPQPNIRGITLNSRVLDSFFRDLYIPTGWKNNIPSSLTDDKFSSREQFFSVLQSAQNGAAKG